MGRFNLPYWKQSNIGFHYCRNGGGNSPVVGAPIAIVAVILELTASYDMALVSLGSVVTSSLTVSILFGYSFLINSFLIVG